MDEARRICDLEYKPPKYGIGHRSELMDFDRSFVEDPHLILAFCGSAMFFSSQCITALHNGDLPSVILDDDSNHNAEFSGSLLS